MAYDFQTPLDRKGTNSLKWDNVHHGEGLADVVPLWVADMDFPVLPEVQRALTARVAHPIYGYTNLPAAYFEAVIAWHSVRYSRTLSASELVLTPSVLHAMSMAIRTFSSPGDTILNLPPVYYPFFKLVNLHDRNPAEAPLVRKGNRWEMDFPAMENVLAEAKIQGKPVKLLLFSSPHNPTGRVWSRDELEKLATLAHAWDFIILSDEIHADLTLPGFTHISTTDLPSLESRSLVFTGPNKTFNMAGLHISHVIVKDAALKSKLKRTVEGDFYDQPNVLSLTAALAAYQHGGSWVDELKTVLADNLVELKRFLTRWKVETTPLEGTYLVWVDFSQVIDSLGFTDDRDFAKYLEEVGRVKMNAGSIFKTGGSHHLRFNIATPKATLLEGLARLGKALDSASAKGKNR